MPETPKRNTKGFEPQPDVAVMLERARKDGITLHHIVNSALRDWLTKKGYARKREHQLQAA